MYKTLIRPVVTYKGEGEAFGSKTLSPRNVFTGFVPGKTSLVNLGKILSLSVLFSVPSMVLIPLVEIYRTN